MKRTLENEQSESIQSKTSVFRDLALLFSVPVTVLLIAAGIIYGPQIIANPHDDFLYVVCSDYGRNCADNYTISSQGELESVLQTSPNSHSSLDSYYRTSDSGVLYFYDISKDTSTRLTLAEAKQYDLSRSEESSDGYRLKGYSSSGGGFLFWGNDSSGWQLENGLLKKRITLAGNDYDSKQLIGWIK